MISHNRSLSSEEIIAATKRWLEKAVIGLGLCPFAKPAHIQQRIRYYVCSATTTAELIEALCSELCVLKTTDAAEVETTLLIHPYVLTDFLEFNDFLDIAEAAVEELGFDGEFQIASFHPDYQFADTQAEDIENYTNRSPFPILHLLRESSLENAINAVPDTAKIYEKNIETMRRLKHEGWSQLWDATASAHAVDEI